MGMNMKTMPYLLRFLSAALLALAVLTPVDASAFEDVNMGVGVSVDGGGNILVQWSQGGFDEYHVGWRVNGGPRGSRTRSGDKRFTVLMHYSPGSVYDVEVQGCTKHTFGHDECTSWDRFTCGSANLPCPGSPEAIEQAKRRHGHPF